MLDCPYLFDLIKNFKLSDLILIYVGLTCLKKRDLNKEINNKNLKLLNSSRITSNINEIKKSNFFIITVPTPLKNNIPDLKYLEDAFKYIYKFLKQDDIIIVESTVYPGATKQLAKKFLKKIII